MERELCAAENALASSDYDSDDSIKDGFIGFSPPSSPNSISGFVGFSPPSSPSNFITRSLIKSLEKEIQCLVLDEDKQPTRKRLFESPEPSDVEDSITSFRIENDHGDPVITHSCSGGAMASSTTECDARTLPKVDHPPDSSSAPNGSDESVSKKEEKTKEAVAGSNRIPVVRLHPLKVDQLLHLATGANKEPSPQKSACMDVDSLDETEVKPGGSDSENEAVEDPNNVTTPLTRNADDSPERNGTQEISADVEQDINLVNAPFHYGWKREVNMRVDGGADIVYIHPLGLRLKDIDDLTINMTEGLTLENFSFSPKPLQANHDFEIIVPAFPKTETEIKIEEDSLIDVAPTISLRKSGRIPIPSSHYKISGNAEEDKKKVRGGEGRSKLLIKIKPLKTPVLNEKHKPSLNRRGVPRQLDRGLTKPGSKKKSNDSFTHLMETDESDWSQDKLSEDEPRNTTCSMTCPKAMALVPSLMCSVCLCLYHPECAEVGKTGSMRLIHGYVCKGCRCKRDLRGVGLVGRPPVVSPPPQPPPAPLSPCPPAVTPAPPPPLIPQFMLTLNNRRFIAVPNLSMAPPAAGPPDAISPQPVQGNAPSFPHTPTENISKPEDKNVGNRTEIAETKKNFVRDLCSGYSILLRVCEYLSMEDLLNAGRVCRLWRDLSLNPKLWREVRIKNSIKDWIGFATTLKKGGTQHLDLSAMTSVISDDEWRLAARQLRTVTTLRTLLLPLVTANAVSSILQELEQLTLCHSRLNENSTTPLDLNVFTGRHSLEELVIMGSLQSHPVKALELQPISETLRVLSLRSFSGWNDVDISFFRTLSGLTDLEIGDCSSLPDGFSQLLSPLRNLRRLRLESYTGYCQAVPVLHALGTLPQLLELEMINFDGGNDMDSAIGGLRNLASLLLIPKFDNQAATKISSIIKGVYQLKDTLTELVWVFTNEFLQVTELYNSKNKKSPTTESCVPVLTPIPIPEDVGDAGEFWEEMRDLHTSHDTPFAVVPISALQQILTAALPNTRAHVTKMSLNKTIDVTLMRLLSSHSSYP